MRILGFKKHWEKLDKPEFTTFRYPRGDRDWEEGEVVKVVIQPRKKGGGNVLGTAQIIDKVQRELDPIYYAMKPDECPPLTTDEEARADGFFDLADMNNWLEDTYGRLDYIPRMNKLTLVWVTEFKELDK